MQAVLEIKNFTKEYAQGKKAVDDLSLAVMPGEIHGLLSARIPAIACSAP